MKARVIDFETTGRPEDPQKAICEVGWTDVDVDTLEIGPTTGFVVNPGHPIPAVTRAVHHISDADVKGAPSPTVACAALMEGMEAGDVFVAHNADFEAHFFGGGGHDWICTYKAALRVLPDAPGHNNQTLRYWLGLELPDELAMPPHRAAPDSYVTAHIFAEMLRRRVAKIEDMVAWNRQPALQITIGFGKHRGTKWRDLPSDYLEWVAFKSELDQSAKYTARVHLGLVS